MNVQEAIRLHEAGGKRDLPTWPLDHADIMETELEKSTEMFRRLAEPTGANNALSQVLYGLALR